MLEYLDLRNFQCHARRRITFSPHITCLVAPSDTGKTAILRALRWVALNRPQGDAFVRHGQKTCAAALGVDGAEVVRERSTGVNGYTLDQHRYEAFGAEVPEDIIRLLNVTELNFAKQLAAPFWLTLPAGEVSRELNAVVRLDLIDKVLSLAGADVRRTKAAVDLTARRLAEAEQTAAALSWVPGMAAGLEKLTGLETAAERAQERSSRARTLTAEATRHREAYNRAEAECGAAATALLAGDQVKQAARRAAVIRTLLDRLRTIRDRAAVAPPPTDLVDRARTGYDKAAGATAGLRALLSRLTRARVEREEAEGRADNEGRALDKLARGRCPLCGRG